MGHFNVQTRVIGPTGISEMVDLFVDTGATLIILPRAIAERLELRPTQTCQVELGGGVEQTWPVGEIRVALEGREAPMLCLISEGGPAILGVVALESLGLAVDPVGRRLVPSKFFVMPSVRRVAIPA
ncbi:MAG TPA: retroviral-like aspartic protease family protein [Methylomirabilota bacterium]|jgi:predicted aspartyl protease|nr:retroviral-like aspartic protease family protein [Methylomirabilota bacterium]